MKTTLSQVYNRLFLPWNLSRFLFVGVGIFMLGQAMYDRQVLGIILGLYFVASGLFAWGCAGGSCALPLEEKKEIDIK